MCTEAVPRKKEGARCSDVAPEQSQAEDGGNNEDDSNM